MSEGQEIKKNAIGIKIGGGKGAFTQITYQYRFGKPNRLEFDAGISLTSFWSSWDILGMYHRILPIKGNFKWFLGGGLVTGHWNEDYADEYGYDGGMYFGGALTIGAEYVFPEVPIQLALDFTPQFGIINYLDPVGGGFGIAFRYLF